ncbi:MAG: hypothetical protein FWD26_06355 [Treponema sp.]|nr:hypothetical protein [Treponema sp.]
MEKKQNSKQKNTSIISVVVAAACIIIYLGALVQGTIRLYMSIENSRKVAEQEFSQIAQKASDAGTQGFMNQRFIDTINNALASAVSLEALIITGPDGEYAFEKQKDYAVSWVHNSPRFINRFGFSNQNLYRPLQIQDLRNVNIKAVANAFNYIEFTKILKETLLIILVGFAIAFFTMLLQMLLGRQETPSAAAQAQLNPFQTDPLGGLPKGLYSERSNIGWENYIIDRLNAELHRCSSSEKDLAFLIIEFTDLTNDAMFKESAEEAVSLISSRDLLFEFGKWGIAAILPGVSLENAISKAEHYHQQIMEKFPRGYNKTSSLCIGITSRSGRLLNADRLILEGTQALKKSKEDPKTSIIAFKSDPEKYREFIRTHS